MITANSKLVDFINHHLPLTGDPAALELWNKIQNEEPCFSAYADDIVNRPKFVNLQAFIESALATSLKYDDNISGVVGVIHTPLPPTPLRMDGQITEGLVSHEIMQDPMRIQTVLKRANILRDYLDAKGTLIAAYGKNNVKADTAGIEIFKNLLKQYPHYLIDYPLTDFDVKNSGATYLIQEHNSILNVFMISATQAASHTPQSTMTICFGPITNEIIHAKFLEIDHFFSQHNLDIKQQLTTIEFIGDM